MIEKDIENLIRLAHLGLDTMGEDLYSYIVAIERRNKTLKKEKLEESYRQCSEDVEADEQRVYSEEEMGGPFEDE